MGRVENGIPRRFPVEFQVEKVVENLDLCIGASGFVEADNLSSFCLVNERVGARVTASGLVLAHRDDGRRFIVRAHEILSAFVELERQVLSVTFYLDPFNDCN